VIAAVRDPSSATSKSLAKLPVGPGSTLITVLFDASSETSIKNAINTLTSLFPIKTVNVVIAAAGIVEFEGTVLQTSIQGTRDQYNTNLIGNLALFQNIFPLLKTSEDGALPKFVTISSTVGSIGDMENWPMNATAYGMSKVALNWLTKKIHIENKGLIAFSVHPGYVFISLPNIF